MNDRPNFYELSKIDPTISDEKEILKLLSKLRNGWNNAKTTDNPELNKEAEIGLKWFQQMKEVLLDPDLRRKEIDAFEQMRADRQKDQEQELDKVIAKVRKKGEACEEKYFHTICKKFQGVFSAEEIRRRLESAGIAVRERREFLGKNQRKELQQHHSKHGSRDLYDFLGQTPDRSHEDLFRAADLKYKELKDRGRTDEQSSAAGSLCRLAMDLFKTAEGKQKYDNDLAVLPMQEFGPELQDAGALGEIEKSKIEELIARAKELGVADAVAYSYIMDYVERERWEILETPVAATSPAPPPPPKESPTPPLDAATEEDFRREDQERTTGKPSRRLYLFAASVVMILLLSGLYAVQQPQTQQQNSNVATQGGTQSQGSVGGIPPQSPQGQPPETKKPETKKPETKKPETKKPETEPVQSPSSSVKGNSNQAPQIVVSLPPPPPQKPSPAPPKPPPPKQPPLPTEPIVSVVVVGNSGLAAPVERYLTQELQGRSFQVVRPGGLPQVKSLIRNQAGEIEVLNALAEAKVHVLLWAETFEISRRELRFMGRTDTAVTSSVEINAFLVEGRRQSFASNSMEIEHTGVNLNQKAEQVVLEMGYELTQSIQERWDAYRSSSGAF